MIGFILFLSILLQPYTWGKFIDQMKHATDQLSIELKNLLKETTQYDILESEYKRLYNEKIIEISKTSVKNVSVFFAKNLQNMLNEKSESLSNIKERATFLYENYKNDPEIQPYDYYNRRSGHPVKEEITFFKGKEININRSHVQAPTNIFDMHPKVLNAAKWSEKLDEVFTDNYNKSRDLLWQYIGTESGMFRSYPGKK